MISLEELTSVIQRAIAPLVEKVDAVQQELEYLKDEVAIIKGDMAIIKGDMAIIKGDMAMIKGDMAIIKGDMAMIKGDMATMKGNLATMTKRYETLEAKMYNASIGRDEEFARVPFPENAHEQIEYPPTIGHLLVAGNEKLPNGEHNSWNRRKSLALLKAYIPDYETDGESDNEDGERSRNRCLRVAKVLGVTRLQLNLAQLSL